MTNYEPRLYGHRIGEHIGQAVQADFAGAYVRIEAAPNMIYCAALLADGAGLAAAERR